MAHVRPSLHQQPFSGNDAVRVLLQRFHEFAEQLSHMSSNMHDIRQSLKQLAESLAAATAGVRGTLGFGRGMFGRLGLHAGPGGEEHHGGGGKGGGSSSFPSPEQHLAKWMEVRVTKLEALRAEELASDLRWAEKRKILKEQKAKEEFEKDQEWERKSAVIMTKRLMRNRLLQQIELAQKKGIKEGELGQEVAKGLAGSLGIDPAAVPRALRDKGLKFAQSDVGPTKEEDLKLSDLGTHSLAALMDVATKLIHEAAQKAGIGATGHDARPGHTAPTPLAGHVATPPPLPPGSGPSPASSGGESSPQGTKSGGEGWRESFKKLNYAAGNIAQSVSILTQQLLQAAAPDLWSTFTGSIQLVALKLGEFFIPVIIEASRGLQGFAEWLGSWSEGSKAAATSIVTFAAELGIAALAIKAFTAVASIGKDGLAASVASLILVLGTNLYNAIQQAANNFDKGKGFRSDKEVKEGDELARKLRKAPDFKDVWDDPTVRRAIGKERREDGEWLKEPEDEDEKRSMLWNASVAQRNKLRKLDNNDPEFSRTQGRIAALDRAIQLLDAKKLGINAPAETEAGVDNKTEAKKQLLLAMPSIKATPAYSSIEDAYKKIQLAGLAKDPLEMQIQREQLNVLLKLLEKAGGFEEYVEEMKRQGYGVGNG